MSEIKMGRVTLLLWALVGVIVADFALNVLTWWLAQRMTWWTWALVMTGATMGYAVVKTLISLIRSAR